MPNAPPKVVFYESRCELVHLEAPPTVIAIEGKVDYHWVEKGDVPSGKLVRGTLAVGDSLPLERGLTLAAGARLRLRLSEGSEKELQAPADSAAEFWLSDAPKHRNRGNWHEKQLEGVEHSLEVMRRLPEEIRAVAEAHRDAAMRAHMPKMTLEQALAAQNPERAKLLPLELIDRLEVIPMDGKSEIFAVSTRWTLEKMREVIQTLRLPLCHSEVDPEVFAELRKRIG